MPTMDASSSSSSSWKYDVFLSFRGEDTRKTFTAHLYDALCRGGINTFIDDHKLRRGQVISPALAAAIENSMISIIVLSQKYASSGWCLEELVKILESKTCMTERVLPIFYNVDPSDIRKQRGEFGKAFNRLVKNVKCQKMEGVKIWRLVKNLKGRKKDSVKIWRLVKDFKGWKKDRAKIWRKALIQVANIAGWDSRNCREPTLIKEVITEVSNEVFPRYSSYDKTLVGMCSRIQEVESLLCITSFDVRIIGICGIGGIGKTTLANAIYNQISHQFESAAFLHNVAEDFRKQGLIGLQQKLLSLLVDDGNLNIKGCTSIKGRLCSKKLLIVLDNVKDRTILEFLTEYQDSFGQGSRIIVTTTEKHLLTSYSVKHCEVRELNRDEAMKVLTHYSLKHELPKDDAMELSARIANYARGLPLALKVLGSSLFGMEKHVWRSHLDKLKSSPHPEINQLLQISYDELDNKVKNIFLDIACFFKGEDKDHVMAILDACGFFPDCGVGTLCNKSLINISYNKLQMHDLIQDMGMEVVRQKYPGEPGKWSRLWSHEDISHVFTKNKGTEEVEGIFLNLSNLREINFTSEGFARMNKLRLLKVYRSHISAECKVQFSRNFKFHSDDLRYLYWHGYSLKSLPYEFNPENLVELNMPYSHIEQLWEGKKALEKLKFMDLSHSRLLQKTPDLSRATNLERLVLEGCTQLCAVDPSIEVLKKLIFLNLRDCINFRDFPSSIKLESLQILILSGCSKLRKFPEVSRSMKHLSELFLDGTAIEELPSSIEYATGLVLLDLTNCKELKSLPNVICNLESLKTLLLSDCSKLKSLPQNFGKLIGLRKLHAERTALRGLPDSFVDLRNLEEVSFSGFKGSPTSASWHLPPLSDLCFLKWLNLSDCNIVDGMQLNSLSLLSSLEGLDLSGNNFERLPSSFRKLLKLRSLKLRNCRRLQALPELPSSIEGIYAYNCFKLKDDQSNAKSIVQTLVPNFRSRFGGPRYPQGFFRFDGFNAFFPGSRIPEWFIHQEEGSEVFIKLSPNWNSSSFLGFAFCVVFSLKDADPGVTHILSCSMYRFDGDRKMCLDARFEHSLSSFQDELIKSDHMWLGYLFIDCYKMSAERGPPVPHIGIKLRTAERDNIIKSIGVRLMYTEDMRDNHVTMSKYISDPQPSSVTLEELDHPVAEDSEVKRSLDGGEPSGIGLELENDDEYNAYEVDIPSGSGWSVILEELDHSGAEDSEVKRSLDGGEPSGSGWSVILEELDHSGAEDSEVNRSLDGGELSGIGLELENDDEYNTYEEDIPSGSGWSIEDIQLESTTDSCSIDEGYPNESAFHQDVEESVSEDTISGRILEEAEPSRNECSDNDLNACHGSKAEERKNIERRSHLQWNATFAFGFIFFVGVGMGILGSFWMKGRTSERKMKKKEKEREK